MIKLTSRNLNIGLTFNTFSSDKNCLRYLKTLKYEGLSGVPKLTINSAFFIFVIHPKNWMTYYKYN